MKKKAEKAPKEKADKGAPGGMEEETSRTAGLGLNIEDKSPIQSIDDYQCCGILDVDFPEVCSLLGIREIPAVHPRPRITAPMTVERGVLEDSQSHISHNTVTTNWCPKPSLQVELENDDFRSVREVRVFGWRVDRLMARALSKTLPSLSNLQKLHLWSAGLTEETLNSLKNTLSLCFNLRTVILEGTRLPEQCFHILIAEDSMLAHLSLRNNQIGEMGARLIGGALSTSRTSNKSLLSLNLAFNSIGDTGAKHIAQGLRLNRTLLCLSLAYNQIGDAGAACLAEILGPFALTHEEIVERRILLSKRVSSPSQTPTADPKVERPLSIPSSSSMDRNVSKATKSTSKKKETPRKEEKLATGQVGVAVGKKEEPKLAKKGSDTKVPRGRGTNSESKEKCPSLSEQGDNSSVHQNKSSESLEVLSPLLEAGVQHREGFVLLPGNSALTTLNLSGNRLTEQSLHLLLSSVTRQTEGGGLLRLSLSRNRFPSDCEPFIKIQELMSLRDPLNKSVLPADEDQELGA